MYSDSDIDDAVAAGALSPKSAAALRAHVARNRAAPAVDEEHFRLITGFNDVFVVIAMALALAAIGWIGVDLSGALGGGGIGLASWGLAEYFTRRRRMALPSIVLLLTFVGGVFWAVLDLLIDDPIGWSVDGDRDTLHLLYGAVAAAIAALAAWLHWRRFRVPITVAAGAAAGVGMVVALATAASPEHVIPWIRLIVFFAGVGVFALAMRWDLSDVERKTRRSDVAFWLHLLSAPLIVYPVFSSVSSEAALGAVTSAVIVVILYAVIGFIALTIDRRALLVSALVFLLMAINGLVQELGAISLHIALTALIIGVTLLALTAFWHKARAMVVVRLPLAWRARLPAVNT